MATNGVKRALLVLVAMMALAAPALVASGANAQYGTGPTVWFDRISVPQGGVLNINSSGWQPGASIKIMIFSDPVDLRASLADSLGNMSTSWTVPADFPLGIEFGAEASFGREFDIRLLGQDFDLASTVTELYVGPRLTIDSGERGGFVPYVAGGITWLDGELEAIQGSVVVSDSDDTVAGYVHGGFYYLFDSNMRVGVDARAVFGSDLSLFGADVDADYGQVAITIGGEF